MGSDIDKGNFGDSARNRSKYELHKIKSNHVFDGAGENVHYHSDTESLGSRKSKTRYINPAICIETVESTHSATSLQTDSSIIDDVTPHPHSSYRSNSTPFLTGRVSNTSSGSVKRKSCRLGNQAVCCDNDATPRESRTYREDGADTFRLSVASVSTTTTAKEERERNERKRQEAFEQWLARKEHEKREKARLEKMKMQVAASTTAQQREESFKKWLERKRMQTERRKAEEIMRQYRTNERLELENKKRQRDKEEKLAEWIKKKEEEMKCMRGSVSQMYINPVPWQSPT
ncbi:stress response protein NST1-like isoform X2 [Pararge aegeria]|uniref:stress response protein NST1-like isoform X2 n=1 Tax=Pararge aegeria TaxID=116150 RepID=UPI0019D13CF8|nr:stress response protein NST1-like isoform X2 [Pararge aegeria]